MDAAEVMHAARLALLRDVLLGLLADQVAAGFSRADGVGAVLSKDGFADELTLDVQYTAGGLPLAGEGV